MKFTLSLKAVVLVLVFALGYHFASFSQLMVTQNNKTVLGSTWTGWNPTSQTYVHSNIYFDLSPSIGGMWFRNYGNTASPYCTPGATCPYFEDPIIEPQHGYELWLGNSSKPLLAVYSGWLLAQDVAQITSYSDARLKTNVKNMSSAIPLLMQLRPVCYDVSYTLMSEGVNETRLQHMNQRGKNSVGLIAQEVQEVFPKLVTQANNGYYTLSYTGLIPYLLKAIQEQQKEIEALKQALLYQMR